MSIEQDIVDTTISRDCASDNSARIVNCTLRNAALVSLWTYTDLTVNECARLNVESLDTEKHEITVTEKNGKRTVHYGSEISVPLDAYIDHRKKLPSKDTDALFITSGGKRIPTSNVYALLKNTQKSDNIKSKRTSDRQNETEKLFAQLPPFCKTYFIGIAQKTTELTRLNYARDLVIFFNFLKTETETFAGISPTDFTVEMLNDVTAETIERFLFYVTNYVSEASNGTETERYNDIQAKARKLSSISSMYRYFLRKKQIEKNPVEFVEKPKQRDRAIIRLDPAEVANLLDAIESGEGQTKRQKQYNAPLVARDVAILTLFLGTGIRISECTGINIKDVDTAERAVLITRKGQKKDIVYYGDEVEEALNNYMLIRAEIKAAPGSEDALFLSNQNKRISNRAVQILVKKYAGIVTPLKHITPHKLRSTFGTNLYQETGDIYLVATVLGHKDVNTTRKHYAYNAEEIRINATNKIRLRKESSDD